MARTTVSDCIKHCGNHFELVIGVVNRSKALRRGEASELIREKDREIVHALREVATGVHKIDLDEEIRLSMTADEILASGESDVTPESETEQPKEPTSDE